MMKNISIKRKPLMEPKIPENLSKYKALSFESCNLKELYKNEISKLSDNDLSQLKHIDCFDVFYNKSSYD